MSRTYWTTDDIMAASNCYLVLGHKYLGDTAICCWCCILFAVNKAVECYVAESRACDEVSIRQSKQFAG